MAMVIRSKRSLLLTQAIVALTIFAGAGWLAQSWDVLRSSALGKVGTSTGLPAIAITVWMLGIAIIVTVLLDHWNFQIHVLDDRLLICERLGKTTVFFDNIDHAGKVRLGAGIALKDSAKWLETFEGKPSGLQKLCRTSGFLKGIYGCDICIKPIRLDIGVDEFLAMLNARAIHEPAPPAAVEVTQ
jgi:hypothetical protein